MSKNFLSPFLKIPTKIPPLWLMRQAGRYLPEYRQIRQGVSGFMELCYTPSLAKEVTLQPIRRFDFDAAILFSDILVIPDMLGQQVSFTEGEGPSLAPYDQSIIASGLEQLEKHEKINIIQSTIREIRQELSPEKAMIGFIGSPWTLACYMLEGQGTKEFMQARGLAWQHHPDFQELIAMLVTACTIHAKKQIEAGCDVIQLFDSWAGLLSGKPYEDYVIAPNAAIIARIKKDYPHIPIIAFPRGSGLQYRAFALDTKADAIGIDTSITREWACEHIPESVVLQGNIDPAILLTNKATIQQEVQQLKEDWKGRDFIANLSHGIHKHTPIEHVEWLVQCIRSPL